MGATRMKKVSEKTTRYLMRGMLLPLNSASNIPVFLEVEGGLILPLFTSHGKFNEASKWGGFAFAKPNLIINSQEFHDSVLFFKKKFPFHVVVDPHLTPEGNTRFQLVVFDEEEKEYLNGQG